MFSEGGSLTNSNSFIDDDCYSPIPCPNCGGKVSITNSRDCELLQTYAECDNCDGIYFMVESNSFIDKAKELLQTDFEIVSIKYFYWARSERSKKGYRCLNEWS